MFSENYNLYNMHELHKASVAPMRLAARVGRDVYGHPLSPLSYLPISRYIAAGCQMIDRATRRYNKPEFGLEETVIDGRTYKVTEKIVREKTFCNLIKFQRATQRKDPKMLIVAPMSGHYATLLRGTVRDLLPHYEVYITDWTDAREVPVFDGPFDLDDFIDYLVDFMEFLGTDIHTMAVCQPSVPLLAAISIMEAENKPTPCSMTLIGGPIDTRENPTEVNKTATERPISWFEQHVITRVPMNYPGFMRRVYPGFLQLSGFMTMNLDRHIGEHIKLFNHMIEGDGDSVDAHKKFYNEYLAVMDLPAEFYLQTVQTVFKDHSLPRGKMTSRGRKVDPSAITKTALLTLEGERDDISGVGQTKAAHKLCKNLPEKKRHHYMQKDVGHYGIFNGRRFREHVIPVIIDFTNKQTPRGMTKAQARPASHRIAETKAGSIAEPKVIPRAVGRSKTTKTATKKAASTGATSATKAAVSAKKTATTSTKAAQAKRTKPSKTRAASAAATAKKTGTTSAVVKPKSSGNAAKNVKKATTAKPPAKKSTAKSSAASKKNLAKPANKKTVSQTAPKKTAKAATKKAKPAANKAATKKASSPAMTKVTGELTLSAPANRSEPPAGSKSSTVKPATKTASSNTVATKPTSTTKKTSG